MTFEKWQSLIANVIDQHDRILKPGGFLAVNISDILCFPDPNIPRYQANNVQGKTQSVTLDDIQKMKKRHPSANRYELARLLGCSEQTVQRRTDGNNVRGGKNGVSTKVMLTGCMVAEWAESSGWYLYDRRIWHKDPCWANSRWHSNSYRAVDEFEYVYVFVKPGVVEYDRNRLDPDEWAEWGSRGVWNIQSARRNDRHEAEFPEELALRVVKLFSPENGVVLDPFVGSGTTAVAATMLGRKWIGIDSDPAAIKVAERRIRDTGNC